MNLQNFASSCGWNYVTPEGFPGVTDKLDLTVILMPTWSNKDKELIESLQKYFDSFPGEKYLLDIDEFKDQNEINRLLPGNLRIIQTPVVVFYRSGNLEVFEQGESMFFGKNIE